MCHYRYWGYDICSHEFPSQENQWEACRIKHITTPPYRCQLAQYTRLPVGINFCNSCMDEVPPNHPPVTGWMKGFDDLVNLVLRLGLSRSDVNRFCRDIRNGLKEIRDNAAAGGPNNNFYNDLKALYELYFDRVEYARQDATARRRARHGEPSGSGGASGSQE